METFVKTANKIFLSMEDELSQKVFWDRLAYSVSRERKYIEKLLDHTVRASREWNCLIDYIGKISKDEIVLFGIGIWGETILSELKTSRIKCIIDNFPSAAERYGVKINGASDFFASYNGEKILISSYKNRECMVEQCREAGIWDEIIIDVASVIYGLTEGRIYFDEDIPARIENGVLIDGGSFDGSDSKHFIEKYHGYAICFEPDISNIRRIKEKLKDYKNDYRIIPKALWSENRELSFSANGDCGSHVEATISGNNTISASSIDIEAKNENICMIKMDIEGAELESLRGAVNTIKQNRPVLAISVYHKPEDIVSIPEFIMSIYKECRFYLRHYSFSWYDTVLYVVPKEMI